MPRPSSDMRKLIHIAEHLFLDPEATIEQTRNLLRRYGSLCWLLEGEHRDLKGRLTAFGMDDLERGMIWLDVFAPRQVRRPLNADARRLSENRFLLAVLRQAVTATADYPCQGARYETILRRCYLDADGTSERALINSLHLDRSTYYARKREAILCCGILLFGDLLPQEGRADD